MTEETLNFELPGAWGNKFKEKKADALDEALGIEPLPTETVTIPMREDRNDYETARAGLHDTLGKAVTSLNELMTIARGSQHPRAYEVVNQLLKTIAETNEQLLTIAERQQKLSTGKDVAPIAAVTGGDVINNNLIISSGDLLNMIKERVRAKEIN